MLVYGNADVALVDSQWQSANVNVSLCLARCLIHRQRNHRDDEMAIP